MSATALGYASIAPNVPAIKLERVQVNTSVAVLGLGYVGLPLAQAASAIRPVLGFDTNSSVVDQLNRGSSHVEDISAAQVQVMLDSGFAATNDPSLLAAARTFVICVPTPLSAGGGPDLSAVKAAGVVVAQNLKKGDLVVLESTTYPGTTETVLLPILEESGLTAGNDFHLAFSPERIDPGNGEYTLANTPKIVGGLTETCLAIATQFYRPLVGEVVQAQGLREAEMAKLLENTYRHINIALVNEMLRFSNDLGINLWNVINIAATKPFGFQAFFPGPGVGGHCIPIDPNYLSHFVRAQTGYAFRLVELAQEINAQMPAYVISRLQGLLNADGLALNGSSVLVLGVTYKPNVSDTRESPAFAVIRLLRDRGVAVSYHDPFVNALHVDGILIDREPNPLDHSKSYDAIVMLQAHSDSPNDAIAARATRFLDTRGVLDGPAVTSL